MNKVSAEGNREGHHTASPEARPDLGGKPSSALSPRPMLKLRSHGDDVADMQNGLVSLGYMRADEVNKQFDTHTQAALELFQHDKGLRETGACDAETWAMLNQALAENG